MPGFTPWRTFFIFISRTFADKQAHLESYKSF